MSALVRTAHIHSTESFGTVDGPGIRYIVFFQGCLFRCLYCHNRDTWPLHAGTEMDVSDLMKEIKDYTAYLRPNGGGVTASGGEPMLQAEFIGQWFKACHDIGLTTCLDTNGYAPALNDKIDHLLAETDLVLLDLKQVDDTRHQKLTGRSNVTTLRFAKHLHTIHKRTWIRYVVVPGWTDDDQTAHNLGHFIEGMDNIEKVELLPYHTLGVHKWETMGEDYPLANTPTPPKETLEHIAHILEGYRHKVSFNSYSTASETGKTVMVAPVHVDS